MGLKMRGLIYLMVMQALLYALTKKVFYSINDGLQSTLKLKTNIS